MPSVKIDENNMTWGRSTRVDEEPKRSVPVRSTPERQKFWEEAFRDPEKFMPFFGSVKLADDMRNYYHAAERLQGNDYDDVPEVGAINSKEKFANMPIEMAEVAAFEMAYGDHPHWTPESQRESDLQLLNEFQDRFSKDPSFAGTVGKILGEMPAFMVEFAATGGMVSLGRKGTETLLKKVVLKGTEISVQAGLRTVLNPGRLSLAYENRRLPKNMTVDEDGNISFDWTTENPATSFAKAAGDVYIEMLSEETGEGLTKGLGFVANKVPFFRKLTSKIYSKWAVLHPESNWRTFIQKMGTKAGYHGILGEVGEEYLGDSMRAITNVEDFGAGKNANWMERLHSALETDLKNTPAMLTAFAVPGVARASLSIPGAGAESKRAKKWKEVQDMQKQLVGLEINTPAEIATAEGMLGYEADMEVLEDEKSPAFKEAGLAIHLGLVPKWLTNRILGIEPMLEDITNAFNVQELEHADLNKWTKKIEKEIKGLKDLPNIEELSEERINKILSGEEKIKLLVKKIPSKKKIIYHATMSKFEGLPSKLTGRTEFFEEGEPAGIFYSEDIERAKSATGLGKDQRVIKAELDTDKIFIVDEKTEQKYKDNELKVIEEWIREAKKTLDFDTESFVERNKEGKIINFLGSKTWKGADQGFPEWSIAERLADNYKKQGYDVIYDSRKKDYIILNEKIVKKISDEEETEQLSSEEETELPLWELSKLNQFRDKLGKKITSISVMRDLLDTYEEAPEWLDKDSTRVFNQVRELTNYLLTRANIVRTRMGLPIINKVSGYITHWMDAITKKSLEDAGHLADLQAAGYTSPLPGWMSKILPGVAKKMDNPYQKHREAKKMMEKYFSKDLGSLLRTMINYDLRDIYLLEPYHAATEELSRLREAKLIPQSTFEQVSNYLLYDIRKFKTPLDEAFNATAKKPVEFINKVLKPFGKTIYDPSRSLMGTMRRMGYLSGLGFRVKPGLRNLGQRMLLMDLYRGVDIGRAQAIQFGMAEMPVIEHPITREPIPLMEYIQEQDWYKLTFSKFEDIVTTLTGLETKGLGWYSRTHQLNVNVSAMTGYFDWLHNYNLSKDPNSTHYKNCWIKAKELGVPVQQLLTGEDDMMWSIHEAVRRTQWEYFSTSMPGLYRGEVSRTTFMFQSWWMNYFLNHARECLLQTITGRNSRGKLLTPGARLRAVKGMGTITALGRVAEKAFDLKILGFLLMPFPGYLPPVLDLIAGMLGYLSAYDDEKKRKQAAKKVMKAIKFWMPFSVGAKELFDLLSGEKDISDYLLYTKPKKKED